MSRNRSTRETPGTRHHECGSGLPCFPLQMPLLELGLSAKHHKFPRTVCAEKVFYPLQLLEGAKGWAPSHQGPLPPPPQGAHSPVSVSGVSIPGRMNFCLLPPPQPQTEMLLFVQVGDPGWSKNRAGPLNGGCQGSSTEGPPGIATAEQGKELRPS